MEKYVFERVICVTSAGGAKVAVDAHHRVINKSAEKGLRYIGWIPVLMDGYGHIKEIDLIFEERPSS